MDGLLIAEQLDRLAGRLPSGRGAWRFPDDRTAVLPLQDGTTLWLSTRPPEPRFEVRPDGRDGTAAEPASASRPSGGGERAASGGGSWRSATQPRTPFQAQLTARATGDLVVAEQLALDRVMRLSFGEGDGFVPERPIDLMVELTGRNANLILVAGDGRIVGAQRVVPAEQNRHRQVRPGVTYVPPPPYDKLDPRNLSPADLLASLRGRPLRDVRSLLDGVGPQLYAVLTERLAPVDQTVPLAGHDLDRVVAVLLDIVAAPAAAVRSRQEGSAHRDADRGALDLSVSLRRRLTRSLQVAEKRVVDARLALAADQDAAGIRAEADLLLATAATFAPRGDVVELVGFDGRPVRLTIDPTLDAAGNAAQRYDRARRKEARAARALHRLPELETRVEELARLIGSLQGAEPASLRALDLRLRAEEEGAAGRPARAGGKAKPQPLGVRFVDPRGFEVLVGRSAKENDAITFGVARSRDLWLHVQGYQGSHVLVRTLGREVPFDTVLFAARLAAGFSRAKASDNVPVDYTERKNVWRVKGAPPGAVNIAHQKTVYVTPARSDAGAANLDG